MKAEDALRGRRAAQRLFATIAGFGAFCLALGLILGIGFSLTTGGQTFLLVVSGATIVYIGIIGVLQSRKRIRELSALPPQQSTQP